ncbi:hypothetical protein [uncultured Ilyobacter sp.]|uniref:hypothetical protein n=1 Tax=uncultured Ilyobacter sp. TaxID=544433 RepID=UPI0029C83B6D|nr:hypothetical protein [uncultured Ilyobacter sp.]
MKEVRLGILGLGVIGRALIKIIQENHTRIMKEYGIDFIIKRVYTEEKESSNEQWAKDLYITNNIEEVIFGERIDIVCETLEGKEPEFVRKHIIRTLKGKRSMIISNSRALASDIREIIKTMSDNKVEIRYNACVGGGIPVATVIETTFTGDRIKSIGGILSRETNSLYSLMKDENMEFLEALEELNKKVFIKNITFSDLLEHEIMSELVILGLYAMNTVIDLKNMKIEPTIHPDKIDFNGCRQLEYTIKPMGILNKNKDGLFYYTGPVAIKEKNILANISGDDSLVFLDGEKYGRLGFMSQKMEENPTALAMFDDLVNLLTLKRSKNPIKININETFPQKKLYGKYIFSIPWRDGINNFITAICLEENITIQNMFELQGRLFFETKEISWNQKEEFERHLMEEGIQIKSSFPIFS